MKIILIEEANKGYAEAKVGNEQIGKMTYSFSEEGIIMIDSTYVFDAYKGQGIGKEMLYKIVEMARLNNIKIIPLCPFSISVFEKNVDIQDVLI